MVPFMFRLNAFKRRKKNPISKFSFGSMTKHFFLFHLSFGDISFYFFLGTFIIINYKSLISTSSKYLLVSHNSDDSLHVLRYVKLHRNDCVFISFYKFHRIIIIISPFIGHFQEEPFDWNVIWFLCSESGMSYYVILLLLLLLLLLFSSSSPQRWYVFSLNANFPFRTKTKNGKRTPKFLLFDLII